MPSFTKFQTCALMFMMACVGAAHAAPPTDAEITVLQAKLREFQTGTPRGEMTYEKYQAFIGELLKDVNPSELSAAQMEKLFQMLQNVPAKKDAAQERLKQLAAADDVDGARAAVMYCQTMYGDDMVDARLAAYRRALTHPALGEVIRGERGTGIFQQIGYAGEEVTKPLAKEVLGLQQYLTADLPPESVAGTMDYLSALNGMGDAVDAATKESVRTKMVAMFKAAAQSLKEGGDETKKGLAEHLEGSVAFLDGAASRGTLMDHPAPALTFSWFSGDQPAKTLADLKGKVVVVDFWATWCGPCIGTFPQVRELQKHYEGYEVVIVGVTSLQGKHHPGNGEPVDTEGNPQKEYDLMKEFMAKQDMTWPVAFSEQEVFNPDFGVRGIPHVAIVDAEGIVRYNGLHPGDPLKVKAEKIDALLKKAGLPTPDAVVEEPKAEEEKGAPKGG